MTNRARVDIRNPPALIRGVFARQQGFTPPVPAPAGRCPRFARYTTRTRAAAAHLALTVSTFSGENSLPIRC